MAPNAISLSLPSAEKPLPSPGVWGRVSMNAARARHFSETTTRRLPTAGWRTTMLAGGVLGVFVLVLNIALLAWAATKPLDDSTQTRVLATGDCAATQKSFTLSHLAINIFSTILLGTSNAAMQCLCAPTRKAIDAAHARTRWLDIGISSFRNWSAMDAWRKWCWIVLVFSTVPLHLLYNSAIFATTSANEYYAILVSSDFREGNWNNFSLQNDVYLAPSPALVSSLHDMVQHNQLIRMENKDCIDAYNSPLVNQYSNVLLVTPNVTLEYLIHHFHHYPTPRVGQQSGSPQSADWMCGRSNDMFSVECYDWLKNPQPDSWNITIPISQDKFPIDHCLLQPTKPQCTIQLVSEIMIVVIICNAIKALIFFALVYRRTYQPLITLGDALASFLDRSDPYTADLGTLSAADVRSAELKARLIPGTRVRQLLTVGPWSGKRRRWFSGTSGLRWGLTYFLLVLILILGIGVLVIATILQKEAELDNQLQTNFGTVSPELLLELTANLSPIGNILIANIPQIVLSLVYLSYNGLFTCILLSHEFARYGRHRQQLRVMQPKGFQRSSYFLSLPYSYAIPLLVLSGLIHWILSQSIFLAEVRVFDPAGELDPEYSVSCMGYSTLAVLVVVVLGSVMLLMPILLGWRRFDNGAPLVESNSLAISATCHPPKYTSPESLVKYGATDGHVCLSDGPVDRLVPGQQYGRQEQADINPSNAVSEGPESRVRLAVHVFILLLSLGKLVTVAYLLQTEATQWLFWDEGLRYATIALAAVTMLYILSRIVVSTVRWRQQWRLRRFAWHIAPELLFIPVWSSLYAISDRYAHKWYIFYLSDQRNGSSSSEAFIVGRCCEALMILWIVSLLIEMGLWWHQSGRTRAFRDGARTIATN